LQKSKQETQAQSFSNAISINDVNYIMLKRRNDIGEMPPLCIKRVFCIFAMLDKFLGGDGLSGEKTEIWVEDETTDKTLQEKYSSQITTDAILDEIIISTPSISEERKSKWTIVVFSETFFSDDPWDTTEVEKIANFCKILTGKHKNLIISANFLHKYEGASDAPSRRKPINKDFVETNYAAKLKKNRSSNLRFSNYSLIFWDNVPVSCYRKTTYKKEVESDRKDYDSIINHGYGYDFGNWKSYPTPELETASNEHKKLAKLFNSGKRQLVASRICSDMNYTASFSKTKKLLILTANGAPMLLGWKDKVLKTNVCVSDADNGHSMVLLGISKPATQIHLAPFVFNELRCVAISYYGEVENEMVDVGCC
jgi:hypothetical protein